MATPPGKTKAKPDNQNMTRTRSLGRKPKLSSEDGSDQKPEKPLPNYLKQTISSRPDPVKLLKKNNDDSQKLMRRRSFDRPPSSLTSPSTSSQRIPKSLNVSPSRSRDKPVVPREKPVTGLRSSSFHGSRGGPRGGGATSKSPHVASKKSGLSSSTSSLKGKKASSSNVTQAKASDKEIALDAASLSSAQEDEEETLKVDSEIQSCNDDDGKETKEMQIEVVQGNELVDEENEKGEPTTVASPIAEDCIVVAKEIEKEEKEEENLINEDKIEETKEEENNQESKGEEEEETKKNVDENETLEKVDIVMKEVESVEETTNDENEEEVKEEENVKEEEEKEKVEEEEKEKVKEEEKKREVVKGKQESPSAYNDVIASKMQENPRKNKVLALAGAFQTVIDYETAASK